VNKLTVDSAVFRTHPQTDWARRYQTVRGWTERLCETLSPEDGAIQSMADVSPTRWHLAHTTWFFETFALASARDYRPFDDNFSYLFNSYYNSLGRPFPRSQRGLLSRPGWDTIWEYRRFVDERMLDWLSSADRWPPQLREVVEIGLQHEQQHQELMLTDIKHVLFFNPQYPAYRAGTWEKRSTVPSQSWRAFDEGLYWTGHAGDGFAFDNERPRHRVFLEAFEVGDRLVTCGEYLEFMDDGGYQRPELWLALGWQQMCEARWRAPLYFVEQDRGWKQFTLAGLTDVDPAAPVCHVSYFEADAYARWAGARLPTEAEWEVASAQVPLSGNFVDGLFARGAAIHPAGSSDVGCASRQMFGDVWEWTASPYVAYPRYAPADGALGEYNGKFMCNQYVLRGGSCATSQNHIRRTYRNFFPPDARWQFSGIRLARDASR
jgi:ergothioneine biosynthesis protein EgtB